MTLVDLGCCMGTDLRKLVVDGFPLLVRLTFRIVCSDAYLDALGHHGA